MPGPNPAEAMRVVAAELPDFPHLPELPDLTRARSMLDLRPGCAGGGPAGLSGTGQDSAVRSLDAGRHTGTGPYDELVLADPDAMADLTASLAEGAAAPVGRRGPGAGGHPEVHGGALL
jgi:hypothetical protein